MPTILIVDDDDAVRGVLYDLLSARFECHTASMADEALQYLEFENYDVILTDIEMPGLDGVAVLKRVQLRDSTTPVIVISGKGDAHEAQNLIRLGAFAYIHKPFELREVDEIVDRALDPQKSIG
jgi:DNA-binding NtrC family response regulator